jgi:hypothetical protein
MPWKESSVMEERLRFVARLLDGEPMTDMCREFGISRKTGYKIFGRYKEHARIRANGAGSGENEPDRHLRRRTGLNHFTAGGNNAQDAHIEG